MNILQKVTQKIRAWQEYQSTKLEGAENYDESFLSLYSLHIAH